ncbi:ethanolamine ammonia-lyase [Sphingobium sp. SCG-1]|nr:ethanolamine ammonia-lyase [Sphingobium sp. SCG-1]
MGERSEPSASLIPSEAQEQEEFWRRLRDATPARIGLGRVGAVPPLDALLDFQLAHARARDAVQSGLDTKSLALELAPLPVLHVRSAAADRATYLRRPDLGRQLSEVSLAGLPSDESCDILFIVGDGLSAKAVEDRGASLVKACIAQLSDFAIGPVILAEQARVALADPIGERLNAALSVMIIGERPGLTIADSLGIYLTFAPQRGRRDSERNCISNIHGRGGTPQDVAAASLARLIKQAFRLQLSGVNLKDDQPSLIKEGGMKHERLTRGAEQN